MTHAPSRVSPALAFSFFATLALAAPAWADRWDDALALVPPTAASAIVVPNPKMASDELQQALERMGRDEVAIGGRPIDMLRAQLGIGAGFDDKGVLAAWTEATDAAALPPRMALMIPVTDAATFIKSTLTEVPAADGQPKRYSLPGWGEPFHVRSLPRHVLVATDAALAEGYAPGTGLGPVLAERLGARGAVVARSGDMLAWAGASVFEQQASMLRANAAMLADATAAAAQGAPEGAPEGAIEVFGQVMMVEQLKRTADLAQQVSDGLLAVDFDALGVGVRAFARFEPDSELAKLIPAGAAADSAAAGAGSSGKGTLGALMGRLPQQRFYLAGGVNLRAMGGIRRMREFVGSMPMGSELPVPAWLDSVQDSVSSVQLALYPSKLSILTGGLGNDSAFFIETSDPAAVRNALATWVRAQQGERNGVRAEAVWEDERAMRDGTKAAAFAVKETVMDLNAAGGMAARLAKQAMVGSRGLHGLAVEVPGGLVVTFSQRPDVLERAMKAASGTEPALGSEAGVAAYAPWLIPDADAVLFIGLGELMAAAQQMAAAMPGDAAAAIPLPDGPVEPIAGAMRSRDRSWEAALVLPSTAMAIGFDAMMSQMMRRMAPPGQGAAPGPQGAPGAPSAQPSP